MINLSVFGLIMISLIFLFLFSIITILIGYILKVKAENFKFITKSKNFRKVHDIYLKEETQRLLIEVEANELLKKYFTNFGLLIGDQLVKQNEQVIQKNNKEINQILEKNKKESEEKYKKISDNNMFLENVREALKRFAEPLKDLVLNDKKYQDSFNKIQLEINKYYEIIEAKNKEIEIYKNGYDYTINKRIVMNILSVIEAIQINNSYDINLTTNLISLLETNVLRQVNVFRIKVEKGDKVDPQIMTVSADSGIAKEPSQVETVYQVISNGYQLQEGTNVKIIKEAKVLAYRRGWNEKYSRYWFRNYIFCNI